MRSALVVRARSTLIATAMLAILCPVAAHGQSDGGNGGGGDVSPLGAYAFQGVPVSGVFVRAPDLLYRPANEAIAVRIGAPLRVADVRRTLQNIYSLGRVSDIRVEGTTAVDGSVVLELTVLPAAHLREVRFAGDSPVRRGALRDALSIAPGDRISRDLLAVQSERVRQRLADRGYERAVVEPELILADSGLEGSIVFHIDAGSATGLRRLEIVGDFGITEAELRDAFGLAEGGVYRAEALGDGLDNILRRLAEARFFHATAEIGPEAVDVNNNTRDLQLIIDAGPPVPLNFRGWDRSEQELRGMLPFFEQTSVADWILKQARDDVVAALQEQGHWKPLVTYGRVRDDLGRNVSVNFTVIPARKADVKSIDISGNGAISEAAIRAVMRTEQSRLLRGRRFISSTWEQDQRSIVALYRRNGFLDADVVDAEAEYDADLDGLRLRLVVAEGDRTVARRVTIDTPAGLRDQGIDVSGWPAEIGLQSGGPFNPAAVRSDETRLRVLLSNQGFRRAIVTGRVEAVEDARAVDVTYNVYPGQRVRVGQLLISGNQSVRDEVIRRQLSLLPGSPLTQEDVILSQSRLYQLGLFSRVTIDTARPDSTDVEPTVVVRVEEGSSRRLSWGLGYSTEEQVRGLVVVGEDNLWGRNHQATVSVRASFAEQRARFIYTDPYLLGRDLEGSAVAYYESVDREGFKVQGFGASFQIAKHHSATLSSIGRYSFRDQQTFDVLIDDGLLEPEDRDAVVGSLSYSLLSDTRPNPIDPRGGVFNTVDVEWAVTALGSESDFVKMLGRSYWYWELPGDAVFVAAARAGLAAPYGGSIVPLPERFFAGGSTTLRGFGRNRAGPKDANGNPLGGDVLLIGNAELRLPLRGDLGAVVFADIGNVFADLESVVLEEVRETLGVGVRYNTPIGPIRLDWGYLIDARQGEDSSRWHFAIGQAF